MGEVIYLSNKRMSFAHLAEPHAPGNAQNAKKRYSADFIMPENDPDWNKVMQQVQAVATEKWKDQAQAVLQMIYQDRRSRCFGDGQEKVNKQTMQPYPEYVGMKYISGLRDFPPQLIRTDGSPVDPQNTMEYQQLARQLYSGCYVNAALQIWAQENEHGRGIRCELLGVQFANDGEPLGAESPDVSGMFNPVAGAPTPVGNAPGVQQPQQPAPGFQTPPPPPPGDNGGGYNF